jgi:hypothetical protein
LLVKLMLNSGLLLNHFLVDQYPVAIPLTLWYITLSILERIHFFIGRHTHWNILWNHINKAVLGFQESDFISFMSSLLFFSMMIIKLKSQSHPPGTKHPPNGSFFLVQFCLISGRRNYLAVARLISSPSSDSRAWAHPGSPAEMIGECDGLAKDRA